MDRRRFLQVGAGAFALTAVSGCRGSSAGGATLPAGGVDVGTVDEAVSLVRAGGGVHVVPEASAYLVEVPEEHRAALAQAWDPAVRDGITAGFLALSTRCPHQGCRVGSCATSGWFECPCHGSRFTRAGERRKGPATRGMSAYAIEVDGERLRLVGAPVPGLDGDIDVTEAPEPERHCNG